MGASSYRFADPPPDVENRAWLRISFELGAVAMSFYRWMLLFRCQRKKVRIVSIGPDRMGVEEKPIVGYVVRTVTLTGVTSRRLSRLLVVNISRKKNDDLR